MFLSETVIRETFLPILKIFQVIQKPNPSQIIDNFIRSKKLELG